MVKIVRVDKTLSPAGGNVWVQVHDYFPEEQTEQIRRGRLLALVSVNDPEESETMKLVELGREVLAFLHEQYFGDLEQGTLIKVKESLAKVKEEFGERAEAAILTEVGEILYAGVLGENRIYAFWNGKAGFVGGDPDGKAHAYSFVKKSGVKIVLGTKSFWEKIGEEKIRELLERGKNGREIVEELGVIVGSGEAGGGVGGVVVQLDEEKEEEIEEIEAKPEKSNRMILKSNFWDQIRASARRTSIRAANLPKVNWGIVFLVFLAGLVAVGGGVRNYRTNRGKEVANRLVEIEEKLKEAEILSDTNRQRSLEIIGEAKKELGKLGNIKNEKAQTLALKAAAVEEAANGLVRVEAKEELDGELLREGTVFADLMKTGKNLLALDKQNGRLVRLGGGGGEVVMGGEELAGVRAAASDSNKTYLLGNFGIKECLETTWKCEVKIGGGEIPDGATTLDLWAENIYVLDGREGRVWKYSKTAGGFGKKTAWMEPDTQAVGADNMRIDGRIWIGYLGGGVGKYSQGIKERFEISGLAAPLGIGSRIYLSDNETKMYVLDPVNSRIVILGKDGTFLKQYMSDSFKAASSLAVFEDKAKIYLAVGSKIMVVEMP